MINIGRLLGEK